MIATQRAQRVVIHTIADKQLPPETIATQTIVTHTIVTTHIQAYTDSFSSFRLIWAHLAKFWEKLSTKLVFSLKI